MDFLVIFVLRITTNLDNPPPFSLDLSWLSQSSKKGVRWSSPELHMFTGNHRRLPLRSESPSLFSLLSLYLELSLSRTTSGCLILIQQSQWALFQLTLVLCSLYSSFCFSYLHIQPREGYFAFDSFLLNFHWGNWISSFKYISYWEVLLFKHEFIITYIVLLAPSIIKG